MQSKYGRMSLAVEILVSPGGNYFGSWDEIVPQTRCRSVYLHLPASVSRSIPKLLISRGKQLPPVTHLTTRVPDL